MLNFVPTLEDFLPTLARCVLTFINFKATLDDFVPTLEKIMPALEEFFLTPAPRLAAFNVGYALALLYAADVKLTALGSMLRLRCRLKR
jgi:hypothetical protein